MPSGEQSAGLPFDVEKKLLGVRANPVSRVCLICRDNIATETFLSMFHLQA
jgi:hypothetical protein